MSRDESTTRDAISRTAQTWRQAHERAGIPMTQAQAEERVRQARVRGDRLRDNANR
jgi:hypothetical protein